MFLCLLGGDGVGVSSRVGVGTLDRGLEEPDEKWAILKMEFVLMYMRKRKRNQDQSSGFVFHAQRVCCYYGRVRLPPNSFL